MLASVLNKAGRIPGAKEFAWRAYLGLAKAKGVQPKWINDTRKLLLEMGETVPEKPKPDGK